MQFNDELLRELNREHKSLEWVIMLTIQIECIKEYENIKYLAKMSDNFNFQDSYQKKTAELQTKLDPRAVAEHCPPLSTAKSCYDQTKLYREFKKRNNTMNLPVAVKEDYFKILYDIHSVQRGHIGINKMEHQLSIRYYGIPKIVIVQFIKFCPNCNLKHVQTSQPRLNPIRSDDFLPRFQIDLVDMRHRPVDKKGRV
ncbi:unnamed protein product [Brachionus calyciflorus]|uniref:Integrase zinc-binding domain-containing protein n=1 Tax=Brachionus calyciflorus TaxID=104777 RepID=A0A813Q4W1_9BILA|nr:unnamed protein product [Brachionus calyciflorus]